MTEEARRDFLVFTQANAGETTMTTKVQTRHTPEEQEIERKQADWAAQRDASNGVAA